MLVNEILNEMTYDRAVQVFRDAGVADPQRLDPAQLKAERKKLIMAHHPDRGGDTETAALINSAFDVLASGRASQPHTRADTGRTRADSSHQDYRYADFIKDRMRELSGNSPEQWTIWGFDGHFLRGCITVSGNRKIFAEMARAMVTWQTKGANPYPCRAVLVHTQRSEDYLLIWADGTFYDKDPIALQSDSFNANPGNDPQFCTRLRKLLDDMLENGGRMPDQPDLGVRGANGSKPTIDVGDRVRHPKFGDGVVINTSVRNGISRVNFDGTNRNVKTQSLTKRF